MHARKIVIPARMKALLTQDMIHGIDIFFHIPPDVRWTRLPCASDAGLMLLLEHPTFPACASLDEVREERWDLTPD